jgi:hypothetical protein
MCRTKSFQNFSFNLHPPPPPPPKKKKKHEDKLRNEEKRLKVPNNAFKIRPTTRMTDIKALLVVLLKLTSNILRILQ